MANNSCWSHYTDHRSLTKDQKLETVPMIAMNGLHRVNPEYNRVSQEVNMPFIMVLLKRRLHILPIVTEIEIIAAFFISYGVAVYNDHVEPDFPYISYTAIEAPERCLFSLLVNMGALLLATNIYIKYLQTYRVFCHIQAVHRDRRINISSLIIGLISAFGLSMVANFQTVDARAGHYFGAGLTFIGGVIYCWMQTALSIRYRRWSCVAVSQLVISIVLSSSLIIFSISKAFYKIRENQGHGTKLDALRGVYLTSTISEWVTAISLVTFVLTYYQDFQGVELKLPKVDIPDLDHVKKNYMPKRFDSALTPVPV